MVLDDCFIVVYLTAIYCSYVERPSPSIDGLYMVCMIYDGHMITGDECGPDFLTFVLRLREKPRKNLNHEIDPTGDRTRACCVRSKLMLPLDQSGDPDGYDCKMVTAD